VEKLFEEFEVCVLLQ